MPVNVRGAREDVLVVVAPKPLPDAAEVTVSVRVPPGGQWSTCAAMVVWQQQAVPHQFLAGLALVRPPGPMRDALGHAAGKSRGGPVELFRDVRLFAEFDESDLRLLCSICLRQVLARGDRFFQQGYEATGARGLFFVESGLIRIFHEDTRGAEETLWTASAGQVFGEMSLWTGAPHSASIRAVTDSVLMILSPAGLHFLKRHHARLAILLLELVVHMLCDRLGRTTRLLFSPSRLG